jgi:glycosyltransferase involved in cell wall biosynthesis
MFTKNNPSHHQNRTGSVCYILSYRQPDYIRTRTLLSALQKIKPLALFQAINTSRGLWRYVQTLGKLIAIRFSKNPDTYILGFRGYELFWPVRLLTLGKRLIFDALMSPYDSLINERKSIKKGSLLDTLVYHYEKAILHNAEIILTDTAFHKTFFQELFALDPQKVVDIPVGADEQLFRAGAYPIKVEQSAPFEVLFYGSFLPLHGVDIILEAISQLQHLPIHFTLIGGDVTNQYYQMIRQAGLKNITSIKWVEFEQLPRLIASADLGLGGPFGDTGQAHRVITGKALQFLAMAKPVIIGGISPEYGFEDQVNCLMPPQGDGQALAAAILWAFEHRSQLGQIGLKGFQLYQERYSIAQISEKMREVIFG